jgi:hypothetical protein
MGWQASLAPEFDPPPLDDAPSTPSAVPATVERPRPMGRGERKGQTAGRFATINAFVDAGLAGLPPIAALTWIVLWRDTGPDGLARSSQAYIARRLGVSTRTVKRAIRRLRAEGLLAVVSTGGLNRGASVYRVHPPGRPPPGTELCPLHGGQLASSAGDTAVSP